MIKFKSVRFRLAIMYALTATILILIYSLVLFYQFKNNVYSDLDKKLRNDVETTELLLEEGNKKIENVPQEKFDSSNWIIELWNNKEKRVFTSWKEDEYPLGKIEYSCTSNLPKNLKLSNDLRVRAFCQKSEAFPDEFVIRVARLSESATNQLDQFLSLMYLGIPLIIIIASIFGYFLARKALAPISSIVNKAKSITAEQLSERLPVENKDDELGELAITFNKTFERLENSFNQTKQFTANASHELRTPLAAIRTMGEVSLRKDVSVSSYQETISNILEETTRLQSLCETLLLLSRADSGTIHLKREQILISTLIKDVVNIIEILAEEKEQKIEIKISDECDGYVDPHFFRQVLMNLLDNAIKYGPIGDTIVVELTKNSKGFKIGVKDHGEGIPKEHQDKIFDRFYRIKESRSRESNVSGAGLGLSICLWIISAHDGKLELVSDNSGTKFVISIPE